jgi:hypothetical protein
MAAAEQAYLRTELERRHQRLRAALQSASFDPLSHFCSTKSMQPSRAWTVPAIEIAGWKTSISPSFICSRTPFPPSVESVAGTENLQVDSSEVYR